MQSMINRRGMCRVIVSDNQSTFKKADKVISLSIDLHLEKNIKNEAVQRFFTENQIKWRFITERSPHRGAFYERLVRSVKEPLRKVLGRAKLCYVEMYTVDKH